MSDLRDQLLKAGLVNTKQVRQAKHLERLHRKEVGKEGLESERAGVDGEYQARLEEKRRRDREREERRRAQQVAEEAALVLQRRVRAGSIREATSGTRRFYFVVEGGRITYLDLSDEAVRRLLSGRAAIVECLGIVRGTHCVIDGNTAQSLQRDHPEIIRFWGRPADR